MPHQDDLDMIAMHGPEDDLQGTPSEPVPKSFKRSQVSV